MNVKTPAAAPTHGPMIVCPHCNREIRLTESLAAPLVEETRRNFQEQLAHKDAEVARRLDLLRQEREDLVEARGQVEGEVARRLAAERSRIAAAEAKKANDAVATELLAREAEITELRGILEVNNDKLAEGQRAHADVIRKERELDDARRELELTIERNVRATAADIRSKARQEADEAARLRVMEKDRTIESMSRTIEELKRQAEQGSQQSQGEVLELDLEEQVRIRFPADVVEPVAKGEPGGDLVQRVNGSVGRAAGAILWETKRTKAWSDAWLQKLREDQRRCGADIALLVSKVLPKGVDQFDLAEDVWIAHPRFALPLAIAIRQTIIEVNCARIVQQGQKTKMEHVYQYTTGKDFRQRVEAIVEKFADMREDLDRERKFMSRQWAKREGQIVAAVEAAAGMVGDLQAIAGKAMPDIDYLEAAPLLDDPR